MPESKANRPYKQREIIMSKVISNTAYKTEQEAFWAGEFGNEYINRNQDEKLITSNALLFGQILKSTVKIKSIIELGCNIGLNLQALHRINPYFKLAGYEINETAANAAKELQIAQITQGTILDNISTSHKYDLTFTKGVLIHINPSQLEQAYRNLYELSSRYILVCEYYNPSPVMVNYRGNADRLFKRDFAGELINKYDLNLIDYGFIYHRDNYFPQDDLTWFLLEK